MGEIFTLPFIQRALLAGALVGVASALLGSFVVIRRMTFIGAGIAHSSFAGVVIGILAGFDPLLSAMVFAVLTGLAIGFFAKNYRIEEESAVGVFFPFSMALGILLLGFIKGYTPNIMGYLFGDILLVGSQEVYLAALAFALTILFLSIFFREMVFSTFDEETSKVIGINVDLVYYLFLFLTAFIIVVSIKIVGIILFSGLLVIPPLISLFFARNMKAYVAFSAIIGFISVTAGLLLSYFLNLPSGATIIAFSFILLLFSAIISKL